MKQDVAQIVRRLIGAFVVAGIGSPWLVASGMEEPGADAVKGLEQGARIYHNLCAQCHGEKGGGVEGEYDQALIGDSSVEHLAKVIHRSMPEDAPEECEDEEARAVAEYIYNAFYSREARARNHPARIEFSRLTIRQYRNTVADLLRSFRGGPPRRVGEDRGLEGKYYKTRRYSKEEFSFDRVDPRIRFDFGSESADPEDEEAEDFAIRWKGSVIAEESGEYELIVESENGFKLWVNGSEKPLIDGWVTSDDEPRTLRKKVRLLGGRAYPIRLDYFKYQAPSASIDLRWKPPHKAEETIPERHLVPESVPSTFVVETAFPPDDSSVGYPRGTSVSEGWVRATTYAAVEVANAVVDRLDEFVDGGDSDAEREERIKAFCYDFAERAFRRPLSDEQAAAIEARWAEAPAPETAVKRVVLQTLTSPRFLYTERDLFSTDDYDMASRLAFGLWDSLPDRPLLRAASQGALGSPGKVELQARRMLRDPRAKAKLQAFFHHWLNMNELHSHSKESELFPGFDAAVWSDLRTSLDLFVEDVVWGRSSDFRDLLLENEMFVNERLAELLGIEAPVEGEGFEKRTLESSPRAGVVTHPYLLAGFSYRDETSPIHRGVFITRNLLGRTLNPPPEAVEFDDSDLEPYLTMREKVAELTKAESCQSCHATINPLGFSLEHFDAVGRYRREDNDGRAIDAVSEYETRNGEVKVLKGARDLAELIAHDEGAQRGFIIQLFNWVTKQPVQAFGAEMLDELQAGFEEDRFNIRSLLVEIAKISAMREFSPGGPLEGGELAEAASRERERSTID